MSFIHYSAELYSSGPNHLYFVLPELDIRGAFSGAGVAVMPGGSLLGLRFARCLGGDWSFMGEMRGPTAYANVYGDASGVNIYASVGFAVAAGLGF
jgi:hypothetical protein